MIRHCMNTMQLFLRVYTTVAFIHHYELSYLKCSSLHVCGSPVYCSRQVGCTFCNYVADVNWSYM